MSEENKQYMELSRFCKVEQDVPLSRMTTLRIGGIARYVAYPESMLELDQIVCMAQEMKLPIKVIGKGSNLLCSDEVYEGIVICLGQPLTEFYFDKEECVAQAGGSLIALAYEAMKHSLSGLEFAAGIPGTLGGATFMNAGAYKNSMKDIIDEVMVYRDHKFEWMKKEECDFQYRHSIFQDNPDWIIVAVRLKLKLSNKNDIESIMSDRRERRMKAQPLEFPSAGSIFRNLETISAWEIIDQLGYRGKRHGGALVSPKHVNFIVNENCSTAQEFLELIEMIQMDAKEKMGYDLKTEVEKFNW
ncbi:MAG: UDP-N-acetylmuramate dehydrogenase [Anaerorhabdus sp.]